MLSGKYLKSIPEVSRISDNSSLDKKMITKSYLFKIKELTKIAKKRGQSLPQMALSWVLRHQTMTSALIGARTVKQLDELRKKMREHGIQFKITKNRITKLALEKTRCKELSKLFTGPTAVALSSDAITSAKILTNFSRENSNLKILGGIMGLSLIHI